MTNLVIEYHAFKQKIIKAFYTNAEEVNMQMLMMDARKNKGRKIIQPFLCVSSLSRYHHLV